MIERWKYIQTLNNIRFTNEIVNPNPDNAAKKNDSTRHNAPYRYQQVVKAICAHFAQLVRSDFYIGRLCICYRGDYRYFSLKSGLNWPMYIKSSVLFDGKPMTIGLLPNGYMLIKPKTLQRKQLFVTKQQLT